MRITNCEEFAGNGKTQPLRPGLMAVTVSVMIGDNVTVMSTILAPAAAFWPRVCCHVARQFKIRTKSLLHNK